MCVPHCIYYYLSCGVFSGSADYSETGAALSSLDGCSDAYLVDFAYFEI